MTYAKYRIGADPKSMTCAMRRIFMPNTAILAAVLLAGCAHQSVATRVVPVPPELTAPVAEPALKGDTNADLVTWIEGWKAALAEANARLRAISGIGAPPCCKPTH